MMTLSRWDISSPPLTLKAKDNHEHLKKNVFLTSIIEICVKQDVVNNPDPEDITNM